MAFYVGTYLILADYLEPPTDSGPWALPDGFHEQHMSDTNNVEELFIDFDDMDVVPTQIQFGSGEWSADEGFDSDDTFTEFYVRDEAFYVRSFSATDFWSEFYIAGGFYVRSFSATDFWSEFYIAGGFYVRSFTATDFWSEFYPGDFD